MVSVTESTELQEGGSSVPQNAHVAASEVEGSTFLGMQNRVLFTTSQTGGVAGVIDISVQPGAGTPLHTNTREALIWYVTEGTLTFHTEQGQIQVKRNGAIFLPNGSTHSFANTSPSPSRALLVCVPGGFEGFLLELGGKLPTDTPAGPPPLEVTKLLGRLGEQYGVEIHRDASTS
jgi:quercetin dioxygenase-like cupin family protein